MAILAGLSLESVWCGSRSSRRSVARRASVSKSAAAADARAHPARADGLSVTGPLDAGVAAGISELRSNLLSALRTAEPQATHARVALASASEGDGKSVVAANLAVALARTGRSVTLVDADLARPAQAAEFKVRSGVGFAGAQRGEVEPAADCLRSTRVDNLQLLPAGSAQLQGAGDTAALLLSSRLPGRAGGADSAGATC